LKRFSEGKVIGEFYTLSHPLLFLQVGLKMTFVEEKFLKLHSIVPSRNYV
jgi:hypothetical protein